MHEQTTYDLLIQLEQAKNTVQYITLELQKRGVDPEKYGYKIQCQKNIEKKESERTRSILLSRMKKS